MSPGYTANENLTHSAVQQSPAMGASVGLDAVFLAVLEVTFLSLNVAGEVSKFL